MTPVFHLSRHSRVFAVDKEKYTEDDLPLDSHFGQEGGKAVDAVAATANYHPMSRGTSAEVPAPSTISKSRVVSAMELASCTALILRNILAKNSATSTASTVPVAVTKTPASSMPSTTQSSIVSCYAKTSESDGSTANSPASSERTVVVQKCTKTSGPVKGTTVAISSDIASIRNSPKAADNASEATNADSAAETASKWTGATSSEQVLPPGEH